MVEPGDTEVTVWAMVIALGKKQKKRRQGIDQHERVFFTAISTVLLHFKCQIWTKTIARSVVSLPASGDGRTELLEAAMVF